MPRKDDLESVLGRPPSAEGVTGWTMVEIGLQLGIARTTARARVATACRAGRMRFAGYRPGARIDGVPCRLPVYALVGKK